MCVAVTSEGKRIEMGSQILEITIRDSLYIQLKVVKLQYYCSDPIDIYLYMCRRPLSPNLTRADTIPL